MAHDQTIFREMGFPMRTGRLPEAVLYSLARTSSLLLRELSKVYAQFGLTAPSFNLLMLLKHGEDPEAMTQHEIGKRLVVSASDMTGLIDRLERKGFVQRTPGRDRRSKLLRITPKGAKLLEAIWPQHLEAVRRLTASVGTRQAREMVRALTRLRAATG